MSINEYEDDETNLTDSKDDEKWTVLEAASSLLRDVTYIAKDQVWEPVMSYFAQKV